MFAAQERWSEPGAELASAMHNPSASPVGDPSTTPDGEQKIKRFLAFSTGASLSIQSSAEVCLPAKAQYRTLHVCLAPREELGSSRGAAA